MVKLWLCCRKILEVGSTHFPLMVESCVSLWKRYKRGRIGDSIGGLENQVAVPKDGVDFIIWACTTVGDFLYFYESFAKHPRYNVFSLYVCVCPSLGNTLFLLGCFIWTRFIRQDSVVERYPYWQKLVVYTHNPKMAFLKWKVWKDARKMIYY